MTSTIKNTENITVCNHPIVFHNLSILRDKDTSPELFRSAARRLVQILFLTATDNVPMFKTIVQTPLMEADAEVIAPDAEIIIAPILRAGLVFSQVATEFLPNAKIHHIGLYRDEETLKPVSYYNNLPDSFKNPEKTFVYLVDPMLATGGSAIAAINLFTDLAIPQENIRFICLISAPEGINRLHSKFPDIKIVTASVDKRLNELGYILPGLGDAGDRAFNTLYI